MKKILTFLVLFLLTISFSNALGDSKEELSVENKIKALGIFIEPLEYPEGMDKFFGENCAKFSCRARKGTEEMSKIFKKSKIYHQKNPGSQLYALAMFELFYLQKLKKDKKKLEKFIAAWPKKREHGKTVVSLLKLNKSREQMRKALGMDLETSVEEAMKRYWIMGDFLEKGEVKKQKKISKEMKKRKKLLDKYKKEVSKFKTSIENQEDEKLYNKILKK